jgi:LDH2 family malate/lactate/ureidoglycolate dehydrogenase
MKRARYRAEDLVRFGTEVLVKVGFPEKQARAAARVLVEADLRGDHAHGMTGGTSLDEILSKAHGNLPEWGFKRIEFAEFAKDHRRYPTILTVDARGALGHYVALEIIPDVVNTAKELGYAKAYIRNSTHFGDCGIYSEIIAGEDLAAKVTCTSPAWTKAFIGFQDEEDEASEVNRSRYEGVLKRFGTNPIAWSIPYDRGIITIDMAATQRAVSPALEVAKYNAQALGIERDRAGLFRVRIGDEKRALSEIHLEVARSGTREEALGRLKAGKEIPLMGVQKGLLKGPEGEDIRFPLAFDEVFKTEFWVAPLGGTVFGYKGFGLNMLIELDNVLGGGIPGLIRILDEEGNPTTPERVSQTIEAYAIDALHPVAETKKRLGEAVETTLACGNPLMMLPGQKEQETRRAYLSNGIPLSAERIQVLKGIAQNDLVRIPFTLRPVQ